MSCTIAYTIAPTLHHDTLLTQGLCVQLKMYFVLAPFPHAPLCFSHLEGLIQVGTTQAGYLGQGFPKLPAPSPA